MNTLSVKIIGALFVILSSYISVRRCRDEDRAALNRTEDAIRFVSHVCESISYHSKPVNDIITSYKSESAELCDFYMRAAETSLEDELRRSFGIYDEETHAIMTDFATQLGHGYADSQLKLCELTERRLHEHYAVLSESAKNKKRSSTATAAFTAASIIFLLI